MPEVELSTPVKAPNDFTIAFLNTYIQEHVRAFRQPHLQLHLPLQQLGVATQLDLDVAVDVTYHPGESGEHSRLSIAWNPSGAPLFPSFEGTITALSDERETCTLTISGTYAPFGVAGAVFDAVLGSRMASAILETLLHEFRSSIEADYQERIRWA